MGEEFWWFYDVIAVAVVAVCAYLAAKKGLYKSGLSLAGFVIAFGLAVSVGNGVAKGLYGSLNAKHEKDLAKTIRSARFIEKIADYINSNDMSTTRVSENKLREIYLSDTVQASHDEQIYDYVSNLNAAKIESENVFLEQLHEGYAEIISGIIADELGAYPAECAARDIREKPYVVDELIPLLFDNEDVTTDKSEKAAKFISKKYLEKPYKTELKLAGFSVSLAVFILVVEFFLGAVKQEDFGDMRVASNLLGGFFGAIKGVIVLFGAAAVIRLYVVLGSDKMLFFNHKAIDRSHIFRYIYAFITDKF